MSSSILILVFAGPLIGPALVSAEAPRVPDGPRWTSVDLSAELRAKDTDRVNLITAGEEQKSSLDRCSEAADAGLCRVIVSAVNVAAIVGSTITGQ
jgi:hypothetical protein